MRTKGNRINSKGAYFGCGGADLPSQLETSSLYKEVQNDYFGLYFNVNGKETKISDTTCLKQGDWIGVRLDKSRGSISFDLNGVDYGIASQDESLKHIDMYPTVDLGMGGDKVTIVSKKVVLPEEQQHQVEGTPLTTQCLFALPELDQIVTQSKSI